jgi:hypothetical protein
MNPLLGHALHSLAEIGLFLSVPLIYLIQRGIRRLIAKMRGTPWPPLREQQRIPGPPGGQDFRRRG